MKQPKRSMKKLQLLGLMAGAAMIAVPLGYSAELENMDVGEPAIEGSTTVEGSMVTIVGAGADIWGNKDEFQFYYVTLSGDENFDATVRLESLEGTHHWAKAMLMARESWNEIPHGGDPHISMMATRTGGQNIIEPQWRKVRDGGSQRTAAASPVSPPYPDVHFRLAKLGSLVSGYWSDDGASWQLMVSIDTANPDIPFIMGHDSNWDGPDYDAPDTFITVGLAVTSHDVNSEATAVWHDFKFLESAKPTVAMHPEDVTVTAGLPVEFSVSASGDTSPPPTYQWTMNGNDIADATGSTYMIDRADIGDNGAKFACKLINSEGEVTSNAATLNVNADTEPPTITSAHGSGNFKTVTITFSEPLDKASAETAANYTLSGGITVSSAMLVGDPGMALDNLVVLETSKQTADTMLTLTVNNVKDASGGNPVAGGTELSFSTHLWMEGVVLHKYWRNINTRVPEIGPHGIPSETFGELRTLAEFPDFPDGATLQPYWEFPANGGNAFADQYVNQITGWFMPPATDDYVFFTNSDDPSALYLSPDDDPANKLLIAQQINWAGARQWQAGDENQKAHKRSDFFFEVYDFDQDWAEDIWEDFTGDFGIALEAGERYYMESLSREAGGGDNHAVTFITAAQALDDPAAPPNGTAPALTGGTIGVYLNPNGASVTINAQPMNVSIAESTQATFSVDAEAKSAYGNSIAYQWQTAPVGSMDFQDIAGATGNSYTTKPLLRSDNGRQYRVMIGAAAFAIHEEASSAASVTIMNDNTPPRIANVFPPQRGDVVVVLFNERMDQSSTETASNYTITGTSVTGVSLVGAGDNTAKLTLAGSPADDFTVSATGVKDYAQNAIASTTGVAATSDLLVYWDFDDTEDDTQSVDLVRSAGAVFAENATYTPDGEGRTDKSGDRALDLGNRNDGSTARVEPANWLNQLPHDLNSFSFAYWQIWNENIGNQSSFWAVSTSSSGSNRGAQAHTPWGNGQVYFDTSGCCDGGTQRINSGNYEPIGGEIFWDEWNHFVFLKDGDTKEIWINGELFHSGVNTLPHRNDFTRLMLGSDLNGNNSHGGYLDDFAVFATPLSEADIVKLADGMRPDEIRKIVPIVPMQPITAVLNDEGRVMIEYSGTLHSGMSVSGPFEAVAGATSPHTIDPSGDQMFFIAR